MVGVSAMTIPKTLGHRPASTYESGHQIAGVSQEASNTINWVKATSRLATVAFVVADKNEGKIHVVDSNGKVLDTQMRSSAVISLMITSLTQLQAV